MKNITLGQFFPAKSFVHELDPRTKILLMIAYIVVVFLVVDMWLFILPFLFVVITVLCSKVPPGCVLRSLRPLRFLLLFMFIINVFLSPGETVIYQIWKIKITNEALLQAIYVTLRLVLLVTGTSLMTLTTSPVSLTDGLEKLLKPFSRLGFPSHELAMMMTIALRFIPTLLEEAEKIKNAQMARGADFESGNIVNRAKSMIPILVPLFVSAFRRADDLAMAMESRCYHGGEGRTRMRTLKFTKNDFIAAFSLMLMGAGIVALQALL